MYKRKNYIVNKEIQYGMIATFLLLVICAMVIFSVGFVAYYLVTGLVGENVYDEFIEVSRQVVMRIRPLQEDEIKNPVALAKKIVAGSDPVSSFISQNTSWHALKAFDLDDPSQDSFEVQKILTINLNIFLKNLIREGLRFYTPERFAGLNLKAQLSEQAKRLDNLQSSEAYDLNLRLLAEAYPQEITLAAKIDDQKMLSFSFQKSYPGLKRYELVLPPIILNNLILMVLIVIIGIFYSHRIAGPLLRIEQDINRAINGEKVVIKLRKKDKLKPLSEQINKLIQELEKARAKK